MKKLISLSFVFAVLFISSCSNYRGGELTGVPGRARYFEPDPFGMIFVPQGSFTTGLNDQDVPWAQNTYSRTVTVDPFWMDETEITNNEYRQFVFWVRDSIIRKEMAMQGIEDFIHGRFTFHFAIPVPGRLNHHDRAVITGLHAAGAGNLGIQPAIKYFVFYVRQQGHRSFFMAYPLGVTVGTKAGTDKNVMFRCFHLHLSCCFCVLISFFKIGG